jgi:hypothetical protein
MNSVQEYTHIGIKRSSGKSRVAAETNKKARNTTYSLMGPGLHGVNGLNPTVSYHMWTTFVLPRYTFGLETISISTKEMTEIRNQEKKILKQIQGLLDNTANAISYLLLGALTVDAHISFWKHDQKRLLSRTSPGI